MVIFHFSIFLNQKTPTFQSGFFSQFGGLERIRTAVDGFADRCLAARPQDHFRDTKLITFFVVANGKKIYFFTITLFHNHFQINEFSNFQIYLSLNNYRNILHIPIYRWTNFGDFDTHSIQVF